VSAPKKDVRGYAIGKRRNNGPEDKGLSEESIFFRLPAELKSAMAERAARDGQSISVAWRRAAELYLEKTK
jgi:hypothetical protein